MLLGMLTGLAAGGVCLFWLFRKKVLDLTFDERQERARGKAYQYGFFTLLTCMLLYGMSEMVVGRWCDAWAGCCLCAAAGMVVFAVTCILKNAYLSLRERPRYIMTLLALLSAANIGIGLMQGAGEGLAAEGVLTYRVSNLAVGIASLLVLIVYLVNFVLCREGEEE